MSGRFVVDNSIVMTWCFKDETDPYADAVLNSLTDVEAIVPAIWPLEVVNVLLVAERRQRLHEADSVRFISLLSQLPIVIDRTWPERMMKDLLALGREYSLSSYDAAYLELAMRQGFALASLDRKLLEAAKRVDIPILDIEAKNK
jgi:predicted nucleic acid-binding protein